MSITVEYTQPNWNVQRSVVSTTPSANTAIHTVTAHGTTDDAIATATFYVLPDFALPEWHDPKKTRDTGHWVFTTDTSLHPFWGTRRLTASALAAEADTAMRNGTQAPSFNCIYEPLNVYVIVGGTGDTTLVPTKRKVTLWAISNCEHITQGSELVLQHPEPKTQTEPHIKRQKCVQ